MLRAPSLAAQLSIERSLDHRKYRYVIGVDEVGRGSWAGPLCVCAAVFALGDLLNRFEAFGNPTSLEAREGEELLLFSRLDDSKALSPQLRAKLFKPIASLALGYGIGMVGPKEIDDFGMSLSLRLGLQRALALVAEFKNDAILLIDGTVDFYKEGSVETFVKGDRRSFSIASSSILAKVTRDILMEKESVHFPWYQLEKNKGYPSPAHVSALHAVGPSEYHRKSWSYVSKLPFNYERYEKVGMQLIL